MTRLGVAAAAMLLAACSQEDSTDIPPLPEPTAETANQLMAEAERAAANAADRSEPKSRPDRSGGDTSNEVTQ